jgi:antitoxin VapB
MTKRAKMARGGSSGKEVLIKRVGSAVVLLPKAKSWDTLVESLEKFPPDFMNEREQPGEAESRDSLP